MAGPITVLWRDDDGEHITPADQAPQWALIERLEDIEQFLHDGTAEPDHAQEAEALTCALWGTKHLTVELYEWAGKVSDRAAANVGGRR